MGPVLFREGARIIASAWWRRITGRRYYHGSAVEICEQVVSACFEPRRRFFRTSLSSYPEFWARDFGRCVPALLALGLEREVGDSYLYALREYERLGRFALVITPDGRLFDFPAYAPDGLAFFIMGLARLQDRALVRRYARLLEREVRRFFQLVVEPATGLVRRGVHFSEAQDFVVRSSSCYSNCMCFVMQRACVELRLDNPLAHFDYPRLIRQHFLRKDRFLDELDGSQRSSGDAAVLPFWSGLLDEAPDRAALFDAVLARLDADGLTRPYPMRYNSKLSPGHRTIFIERWNRWQRDAIWTCLGIHFLEVLRRWRPVRYQEELGRYVELVEHLQCFPEVLAPDGQRLFSGPFYLSEDSMLWAANLWEMLRFS